MIAVVKKEKTNLVPLSIIILAHRDDQRLLDAVSSALFAKQVIVVNVPGIALSKLEKLTKDNPHLEILPLTTTISEPFDFSEIRNASLQKAVEEWVFFVDSDEVIYSASVTHISTLISKKQYEAAYVRRFDQFLGKTIRFGEVGSTWLLRIGKKESLKFLRPVHEVAKYSGNVTHANIILRHSSHQSISEFISKVSFYARIDAHHRVEYHQSFSLFELLFFPPAKFIYNFILKRGFRDGWRGFIYAVVMSLHSYFVRVFMFQYSQIER